MQALLHFFDSIGQYIGSLAEFALDTIRDIVFMFELMGEVIAHLPSYMGWLPSVVSTLVIMIVSIVVIYKVIGREG